MAGEVKGTIFGFDGQVAVRRALKRILANLKLERFNGLEITQVEVKRFLGLPYASVCAHSRHIEENPFLLRAKDHQEWDRAKLADVGAKSGRSLAEELLGDWKKKEVDDLDIAQQKNMRPFGRQCRPRS